MITGNALRKLIVGWKLLLERHPINVPSEHRRTALLVAGWVAQVHRYGRAFLQLEKVGLEHEGHPLVRSALEHCVVAHFVAQAGDAAVITRYALDQVQLAKFAKLTTRSPHDVESPPWDPKLVAGMVDANPPPPIDEYKFMANFADICDRLGIKSALYTVYQVECTLTHPTTNSSGVFLTPDQQHIQADPSTGRDSGLVSMMAHSVYWARRVVADLMIDHPHDEWLDDIAGSIRVTPRLPPIQVLNGKRAGTVRVTVFPA